MSVVAKLRTRGVTAAGFGGVVDYVAREGKYEPTRENGFQKPEATFVWGVTSRETAAEEMQALASLGRAKASPVAHITISWSAGEHPSAEQTKEAAEITMRNMGFEGCQAYAALHRDGEGGYSHLHLIVNRVDADLHTREFGWYKRNLAASGQEIELEQGWSRAEYSREYANHQERGRGLSDTARDIDANRWQSVETHLRQEVTPVVRRDLEGSLPTWNGLHSTLRESGYRYQRTGENGARIERVGEGVAIGAKRSLGFSHNELVDRLGPYTPDLHAGRPFAERVHSATLDVLTKRKEGASWEQIHQSFESRGLQYERHGGGARIVDLDSSQTMKAGDADRRLRFGEMEKRFGSFEESAKLLERREARELAQLAENYAKGAQLARDPSRVARELTAHDSTFTERDLDKYLDKKKIEHFEQREEIKQNVLDSCIVLERDEMRAYTTASILNDESTLRDAASQLATSQIPQPVTRPAGEHLKEQQRTAYDYATRGASLSLITGVPGAGKTTLIKEVAEAYREAGYNVRGTSVSNKACNVLERDTDLPIRNTCKELYEWAHDRGHLSNRDVLIIDEVSMLASDQAASLLSHARDSGATVIALGDHRQFAAVGRGDGLRALGDALGDDRIDLATTRRQQVDWQREATHTMRAGNIREGLEMYREHGHILETQTREEAARLLVDRYNAATVQGFDTGLVAYTNQDVHLLNTLARQGARDRGELDGIDHRFPTRYGERDFAVGDSVVVRSTVLPYIEGCESKLRVGDDRWTNGDTGRIEAIDREILHLIRDRDGAKLAFHTDLHDAIDHAYAGTKHREQGETHDVEFVLGAPSDDARSTLVAMTRHEQDVTLAYAREDFRGFDAMVVLAERFREKEMSTDFKVLGLGRDLRQTLERPPQHALERVGPDLTHGISLER